MWLKTLTRNKLCSQTENEILSVSLVVGCMETVEAKRRYSTKFKPEFAKLDDIAVRINAESQVLVVTV